MARKRRTRANGESAPYQRPDGRWCVQFWVEAPDGSRKRQTVYAKTRGAAVEQRTLKQAAHARGEEVARPRSERKHTVGSWLGEWLDMKRARVPHLLAPTTWEQYEREVRLYLLPALGRVQLDKLTPGQVDVMLDGLRKRNGEPVSGQTRRHVYNRLHAALGDAMRHEMIHRNVAELANRPDIGRPAPDGFSVAELDAILSAARLHRLGALFHLAARSGLRTGELVALRWQDVDLDAGRVAVVRTMRRDGTFAEPKSEAGTRGVPIGHDPELVPWLRQHRRDQAAARLAAPCWEGGDLVFTREDGRPLSPSAMYGVFRRLQARAGLPPDRHRGLHALRKAFGTDLARRDISVKAAQRWMGHSKPELTLAVYTVADDEFLAEQEARLIRSYNAAQ